MGEGAASNAPAAERAVRRYQCEEPSSWRFVVSVERGEEACGKRGRAAVIDEFKQYVHVCSVDARRM
jgi:hypothetical protein